MINEYSWSLFLGESEQLERATSAALGLCLGRDAAMLQFHSALPNALDFETLFAHDGGQK